MPQHSEKSFVATTTCWYCTETSDELLLDTRMRDILTSGLCYNMNPCGKCKDLMDQGVIFISMRDGEGELMEEEQKEYDRKVLTRYGAQTENWRRKNVRPFIPNPCRTGGWVVLKDEAVKRIVKTASLLEWILRHRFALIEDAAWKQLFGCAPGSGEEGHEEEKEETDGAV